MNLALPTKTGGHDYAWILRTGFTPDPPAETVMSLKRATTITIACLTLNLVLGLVLRFLGPVSAGGQPSIWMRHLYSYASIIQMLLLNGPLLLFFVVLRSKQD